MKKYFDFRHLRGDIFGGLTAGIVALPLALAFGVSSGLGPMAGLYGAIFIGFFAALFGGTNTQISGPTAPMTAISMLVIAGIVAANNGDVSRALPAILAVFLLAGFIQIGLGALGLGKYIRYIPYPVVSGFMTAIGVIIILTQVLPAVGYYPKEDMAFVEQFKPEAEEIILTNILEDEAREGLLVLDSFEETIERASLTSDEEILQESRTLAGKEASGVIGALRLMPRALRNISWVELLLALGTIVIIYGFKRITRVVPSTLVALILMSGIADLSGIDYRTIERIPGGFPMPNFEIFSSLNISDLAPYVFSAITLAILGAIDSLLTSVVADNMTRTKHNPNRELVGQGIGNSVAALFGGIPGAVAARSGCFTHSGSGAGGDPDHRWYCGHGLQGTARHPQHAPGRGGHHAGGAGAVFSMEPGICSGYRPGDCFTYVHEEDRGPGSRILRCKDSERNTLAR